MKEICWNKSKDLRPELEKIGLRLAPILDLDKGSITEISYDNKSDSWQIIQGMYDAFTSIYYKNEYIRFTEILNLIVPLISEVEHMKVIRPYIDDRYRILFNNAWKVKSLLINESGYSGYLVYDNSDKK